MTQGSMQVRERLRGRVAILARVACAALLLGGELALATVAMLGASHPAQAQFFPWGGGGDDNYRRRDDYQRPPRPQQPVRGYPQQQQRGGGWFGFPWGGGGQQRDYQQDYYQPPPPRRTRPANVESTRPPAPPKKPDIEPATHVVVIGDTMSEWLAAGLEEAFADTPDIGVTRNPKIAASLLRNEGRDTDAVHAIREALAGEKAEFVVIMTGIADRHAIREREKAKPAEKKANESEKKTGESGQEAIAAPEPEKPGAMQTYEFRSDKWAEVYSQRIDDTIAALRSKRVPVIWVGLPPVRGPRSRADLTFLNDLYKDRAEKAGILYVDVWDGFMEESGEFSSYGPDVMGQVRRLRTGDGVNFTKAGARKLAHFVDREIKRLQQKATPVALPAPDETPKELAPATGPSGPAPRPVAGPVVPLTGGVPTNEGALAGASQSNPTADTMANRVLVKGEAIPSTRGRADDFAWSPTSAAAAPDIAPPAEPAAAPFARTPQKPRPAPTVRRGNSQQRSEVRSPTDIRPVR
ncbi:MAG: DUF459 domain-containing protein [Variibacter sp.]